MIIIKDVIADYKYRLQKTKPAKIMYSENKLKADWICYES